MKKEYVVDTNVLLDEAECVKILRNGEENVVTIPFTVILELDKLKNDPKKRGMVNKAIDALHENIEHINIVGIPDDCSQMADLNIMREGIKYKGDDDLVFITNDRLFHLLAISKGWAVEPFHSSNPFQTESESWTGYIKEDEEPITNCFQWIDGVPHYHSPQGVRQIKHENKVWKIKPKNMYQNLALELLLDPNLDLVTLQSKAGFGKTYLALAAALYLVLEKKLYDKIYVVKTPIELGPSLGFLPGDFLDKLQPYYRPIYDLIDKLNKVRPVGKLYSDADKRILNPNICEVLPITYVRGMNLENAIVIIDETQNLSRKEARAILTRMGENTRCFVIGDTQQVDNPYLNEFNNGLNWVVKLCTGQKNYGHLVLKGVHSRGPVTDLTLKVGL